VKQGNKVLVSWKNRSLHKSQLEVLVSTTNHFKDGIADEYKRAGKVNAGVEKFEFTSKAQFLKVVVKGKHQTASVWVGKK